MTFLDTFLEYSHNKPIPLVYRKFAAISCLSAVLERRVWLENSAGIVYPNLFFLFIAPSGTGKEGGLKIVSRLIRTLNDLHPERYINISPKNFTKPSMMDIMVEGQKSLLWPDRPKDMPLTYTSFYVVIEEIGTLINSYDKEMISFFTELWNCDDITDETRRDKTRSTKLINPQLGGLCGTQPKFISSVFPEEAWEQGFSARMIMVYSGETPYWHPWKKQKENEKLERQLVNHLENLLDFIGEAKMSEEFQDASLEWRDSGCQPIPDHPRMSTYNSRRWQMSLKLSLVAAANRGDPMNIILEDFHTSKEWLLEAEKQSDDIFKHFDKKSDREILIELRQTLWKRYAITGKSIEDGFINKFLSEKVPSEKVEKVFETAVRAGYIIPMGGCLYKPGDVK